MPTQLPTTTPTTLSVRCPTLASESRVVIGRGLLHQASTLISSSQYRKIVIVADPGARHLALPQVATALAVPNENILLLAGGETLKEIAVLSHIWSFFQTRGVDRSSLVVQVGGGALSDVAGFASSTYMRGVPCVTIPTTLLAQVDASIGGKTGINFQGVKNLIGTVQQPRMVLVDIDTLNTLPPREIASGFAEIIKHGLIADRDYFTLATSSSCHSHSPDALVSLVARSIEIKRNVVESDEREVGPRKLLNFGHTIGHAIEAYYLGTNSPLTHGEAISIGMHAEAVMSVRVGMLPPEAVALVTEALERTGLPSQLPSPVAMESLWTLAQKDKKSVGGTIKWSLLSAIGVGVFDVTVPKDAIDAGLNAIGSTR